MSDFKKVGEAVWEKGKSGSMRVPVRVYANEKLFNGMNKDRTFNQITNVASLPGIIGSAMLMPDGHEGYGFPIGGVAAFDPEEKGIVSPGGVGYDINCGVRSILTNLDPAVVKPKIGALMTALFNNIPSGVGSKSKLRLSSSELDDAVRLGAKWAVEKGYGTREDLERIEENGCMPGADPRVVSDTAKKRGAPQFGTLGSGNHFLEVQEVQQVFDEKIAKTFGLEKGKIVIMLHCGSRGFGHQVCDDAIRVMVNAARKYGIQLPDQELCCAPLGTPEADNYLKAMNCAINYAFCNRQVMTHWIRETFEQIFPQQKEQLNMSVVYDVCHNLAKFEEHEVEGKRKKLCIHRKGATRAMGPDRPEVPSIYRSTGQPVIIPGSMGTSSYILCGIESAKETFYSTCFAGGTKILTDKGLLPIHEIYENAKNGEAYRVLSLDEGSLKVEWRKVENIMKRSAATIRISSCQKNKKKNDNTLDVTSDHKMVVFDGLDLTKKEVREVLERDEMLCVVDKIPSCGEAENRELAYLAGVFFTDGYVRYNKRQCSVVFIQKPEQSKLNFINTVCDSFEDHFGFELVDKGSKVGGGVIRNVAMMGEAHDYACSRKAPAIKLLDLRKNLVRWVALLDEDSLLNYLAGVIDGDGTFNEKKQTIHVFSGKKDVTESVVVACLRLGIVPYISRNREKCVNIHITERMSEILNKTTRVKGKVLHKKYGSKTFSVRQVFKGLNLKWPFKRKAAENNMLSAVHIAKFLYQFAPEEVDKINKILASDLRMHRVRKVCDCGEQDVYNLTVEKNHNYVVFTSQYTPLLVKNCHGAGRVMSRHEAIRQFGQSNLKQQLEQKGISLRATGNEIIAEESPQAYKDVDEVVQSVEQAGISKIVAKLVPLGVAKG